MRSMSSWSRHWLQRRLVDPLMAQLRQGTSPDRLALCVAIGVVVGNNPILGTSTILCAVIALVFRLNLPAMQLVQAVMAPTQVLLIIPFVRLGETILGAPRQPLSAEAGLGLMTGGAGHALPVLRDALMHAGLAWLLLAPFAIWLTQKSLQPLFRRAAGHLAARGSDDSGD